MRYPTNHVTDLSEKLNCIAFSKGVPMKANWDVLFRSANPLPSNPVINFVEARIHTIKQLSELLFAVFQHRLFYSFFPLLDSYPRFEVRLPNKGQSVYFYLFR
jgi:hypothetical protein